MTQLPSRSQHLVHVPIAKSDREQLLEQYGSCEDTSTFEGGGEDSAGAVVAVGPDPLKQGGIKATPQRVGLLKALSLAAEGSWLNERLRALKYAANEDRAQVANQQGREGSLPRPTPVRKLVLFAHHELVMDRIEKLTIDALGTDAAVCVAAVCVAALCVASGVAASVRGGGRVVGGE